MSDDTLTLHCRRLIFAIHQVVDHWTKPELSTLVNEALEHAVETEYYLAHNTDMLDTRNLGTNPKLEAVKIDVEVLIAWAEADSEHSYETDAPEQMDEDRARAKILRQVRAMLEDCTR